MICKNLTSELSIIIYKSSRNIDDDWVIAYYMNNKKVDEDHADSRFIFEEYGIDIKEYC